MNISRFGKLLLTPLLGLSIALSNGCVSLGTDRLAASLSQAMLEQTDPEIVRQGAPSYLLLIDSLIAQSPDDKPLLYAGARLYGAYAGGLVEDPERRKILTDKALDYAQRGFCQTETQICDNLKQPFERFTEALRKSDPDDLEGQYLYAASWAGWIQAHSDDWNAVAELAKVEAMLEQVVKQEPGYENGRAQLYLGVINSQIPPALGGRPEIGQAHFEQAIRYSSGKDLMAKLEYARHYARLVFDKTLHDQLLNEVIEADPRQPGLTLSNILAQQQAQALLQEDYF
ncbi:MAG: TRAP transporter TatT component family protein [Candidatus Thiodiazotropha sp.]